MITKSEWTDWKTNIVTRGFFAASDIRINDAKDILAAQAGLDSDTDNFYRGFIAAYNEIKQFEVEDVVDD